MKSYIVRIYREKHDKPRGLVGIVEEAGTERKKVFATMDELWAILKPRKKTDADPGSSGMRAV